MDGDFDTKEKNMVMGQEDPDRFFSSLRTADNTPLKDDLLDCDPIN